MNKIYTISYTTFIDFGETYDISDDLYFKTKSDAEFYLETQGFSKVTDEWHLYEKDKHIEAYIFDKELYIQQ